MVEQVNTVTGAAKGRSGTGESSVETIFVLLLLLVLHLVLLLLGLTATSASAVRISKGCPKDRRESCACSPEVTPCSCSDL
jgi:hypothetical protein